MIRRTFDIGETVHWTSKLFSDLPSREYTGKVVCHERDDRVLVHVNGCNWDGQQVVSMDPAALRDKHGRTLA